MNVANARIFQVACILGFLGVALGAFGAHALQDHLTAERLDTFHTAVRIQMLHVPVLLFLSLLGPTGARRRAGFALVGGIVVFSGSLYALVLLDQSWLGAVTPLGGLSLLVGWIQLALAAKSG